MCVLSHCSQPQIITRSSTRKIASNLLVTKCRIHGPWSWYFKHSECARISHHSAFPNLTDRLQSKSGAMSISVSCSFPLANIADAVITQFSQLELYKTNVHDFKCYLLSKRSFRTIPKSSENIPRCNIGRSVTQAASARQAHMHFPNNLKKPHLS